MGNLLTSAQADSAEEVASSIALKLLCEFLREKSPSDEALAIAYQPVEQATCSLPAVRLYSYFQVDLIELRTIVLLSGGISCVEELPDSVPDYIAAVVGKMCQAERLISTLVTCEAYVLRKMPEGATLHYVWELHRRIRWALEAIYYSCGGDPINFASVSMWHHRLALWEHVLGGIARIEEKHPTLGTKKCKVLKPPKAGSATELEFVIMELVADLCHHLLDSRDPEGLNDVKDLSEVALAVAEESIVSCPADVVDFIRYTYSRALTRLGLVEEALFHFICLTARSRADNSQLCTLLDVRDEEHAFIFHLLNLPEIQACPMTQIRVGRALLPSLEKCIEAGFDQLSLAEDGEKTGDCAHDRLLQLLADAHLTEGDVDGAYDCINEMCLPHWRGRQVGSLVKYMLEQGKVKELCSYPWSADFDVIEGALECWGVKANDIEGYAPLYTWYLSRGSTRKAALVLRSFATRFWDDNAQSHQVYNSLQIALNCLEMTALDAQWALAEDGSIIDSKSIRNLLVLAKAKTLVPVVPHTSDSKVLVAELLGKGHLVAAMDIALQIPTQDHVQMILSFLVDSLIDAEFIGGSIERPWLGKVLASRYYSPSVPGHVGPPESSVLCYFVKLLSGALESDGDNVHFMAMEEMLRRDSKVPEWLMNDCCRSDCNRLLLRLGQEGLLESIAEVLRNNAWVRDELTTETIAFLQQITCP